MKKTILTLAIALFAALAFAGAASAQTAGQVYCGPSIGYADVCPDDIVRPIDDGGAPEDAGAVAGTLPRTGSDSALPLAQGAVVLIAVGGGLLLMASRRRQARPVPITV